MDFILDYAFIDACFHRAHPVYKSMFKSLPQKCTLMIFAKILVGKLYYTTIENEGKTIRVDGKDIKCDYHLVYDEVKDLMNTFPDACIDVNVSYDYSSRGFFPNDAPVSFTTHVDDDTLTHWLEGIPLNRIVLTYEPTKGPRKGSVPRRLTERFGTPFGRRHWLGCMHFGTRGASAQHRQPNVRKGHLSENLEGDREWASTRASTHVDV